VPRTTGYLAPVFAPRGQSVFAIARDVRATITGFGHQTFTPPATVRLHRDRFTLLEIRLSDGAVTVVEEFPPSPLEGSRIEAYHGAIFGVPHAHLRWADGEHLEYEIGVTRHDTPLARTFVIRRVWDAKSRAYVTSAPWQEGHTTMAGDEPAQLHGEGEVFAVPGQELMPCAIAVLRRDDRTVRVLTGSDDCRSKYPAGLSATVLEPLSRRADIERAERIRTTYAGLVARGMASGLPEGQAMLRAGEEMSRLGLFPKTTMLVAEKIGCGGPDPVFEIADEEFAVGLFSDIERALASPGVEVQKSMGPYITHRDYTTSRRINEWVEGGRSELSIRARGACWRLKIVRP